MTESLKQCATCKEWLPATSDYFHKRGDRRKNPWKGSCKRCLNILPVVKVSELVAPEGYKICRKCREEKPATIEYFNPRKQSIDGLVSHCKVCVSKEKAEYKQKNKDKVSQRRKTYYDSNRDRLLQERKWHYWADPEKYRLSNNLSYAANRDKRIEYRRSYVARNRESIRQSHRDYYKRNRDKRIEYTRQYREKNYGRARQAMMKWRSANHEKIRVLNHRRRSRKHSLPDTLTANQWQRALDYFDGCCAYCGRPSGLFHAMAIEHFVPLSNPSCLGTTALNCVPACHGQLGCNNSKGNKPAAAWLESKFGKRKAAVILDKISTYDHWVRTQDA